MDSLQRTVELADCGALVFRLLPGTRLTVSSQGVEKSFDADLADTVIIYRQAGTDVDLGATYEPAGVIETAFSEADIHRVLERTGKGDPANQLDCGACGYPSCREKALAVLRGLAEPEMCIPHMRRLAEQRVDRIIETSPNGIVVLDDRLRILSMNPAFRKMFMCSDGLAGKHISVLMDAEPFERLASGKQKLVAEDVEHKRYNLSCHQVAYALEEDGQYVGIFVNRTGDRRSQAELDRLRSQTVLQARQLLEHQQAVAQQMAELLGENAARGEKLLEDLLGLAGGDDLDRKRDTKQWLTDTYT
jgi:PAS domain S-box-containing protein